jgi:16S rRNA (guanine527-N7)-methyltransferase
LSDVSRETSVAIPVGVFHVKHPGRGRTRRRLMMGGQRRTVGGGLLPVAGILHAMDTYEHQVADGLRALGLEVDPAVVERLALHVRSMARTNEVMNLTSIAQADYVPLHVLDSLTALPFLERAPGGPFADIGSGAGFPGIPLAIVTGRPVMLIESVRKKAAFLEAVCSELRLKATVQPIRAEELAVERPGTLGAVVARAVSALPSLVELASPLLAEDGILICMKGRADDDELARGDAAAAQCGLVRERTESVSVPGVEAERTIITYRKCSRPRVKLPRRTGMAQRQPLA